MSADEIGTAIFDADSQWDAARRVRNELYDAALLAKPGTWSLPPEPGPEVTAVLDRTGARWQRQGHIDAQGEFSAWHDGSPLPPYGWMSLVQLRGPLTDATPTPPLTAAPSAPEGAGDAGPPTSPA